MQTARLLSTISPRMPAAIASCLLALLADPLLAAPPDATRIKQLHEQAMATAVPAAGYQSRVALADSIVKLVHEGVIDPQKIAALYARRGSPVPAEMMQLMTNASHRPIFLTRENAVIHVNLLWALGLANRMATNSESPLNGPWLSRFASTGGWTLGTEASGGAYFNKFAIVALTATQEALVTRIAQNAFRPCCNNSTFFQDCNHGSALLGLLTLGASQGLNEDQLYREALAFNSFWFPRNYAHTALYFKAVRNSGWQDADPRLVMSATFSSASGWRENVFGELQRRGLVPQQGGASCDV
jgi:hypothetical protein